MKQSVSGNKELAKSPRGRWRASRWLLSATVLLLACSGNTEGASQGADGPDNKPSSGGGDGGHAGTATTDPGSGGEATSDNPTGGSGSPGSGASGGAASGGSGASGGVATAGSNSGASGGSGAGATSGATAIDFPLDPVFTPTPADADLATLTGCAGVYNPDQLLSLSFTMDPADFTAILADTSYTLEVPAQMQCEDEPPLTIGIRRKRSGGLTKVGFKVDINEFVAGQTWYGLKKLSLENGVSSGTNEDGAEVRAYLSEYLAWRFMTLSGAISGRAAFVNVTVNDQLLGVYVNVEQVDKRFLQAHFGDDSGWLYKKSGGINDGLKTNELNGAANPYDDYFCFWEPGGNSCAAPSAETLAVELPTHLDIQQFLRFGAVNAFIANTDGPLFKDNNYYYYDYATGPRAYLPWDLDTAMNENGSVFEGGSGTRGAFEEVLFTNWFADYVAILEELHSTRLTADVIEAELTRALAVAGPAFDADPYVTGTLTGAVDALRTYWSTRLPAIAAELP